MSWYSSPYIYDCILLPVNYFLTLEPAPILSKLQASFDHKGDGQLNEAEFERAVISMALGLSDQEIREVRIFLQGTQSHVHVDMSLGRWQEIESVFNRFYLSWLDLIFYDSICEFER